MTTSGLSNYAMERVQNFFLRGTAWSQPSTIYFGLDSVIQTAAAGGTEISGTGYARQAGSMGAFTSRQKANDTSMTWTPGATWPEAAGFSVWDAASGGNLLGWGPLSPKPTPTAGSPFTLAVGEAVITCPGTYAQISNWFLQQIMDKIFDNVTGSSVSGGIWAHLVGTRSSAAGTGGSAISGTGYSSKAAAFAAWASGRNYLSSDVSFSAATSAAWTPTAAGVEFWTNATFGSGNLLFSGDLSPVKTIGSGASVVLKATQTYVGVGGQI